MKYATNGSTEKHKAQLVSKGFLQLQSIGYSENIFPISKINSIHLVLSLAITYQLEAHRMEVKATSLHHDF